METPPPSSHSAHSSLLQHVLLLEQARQQTAMLAGMLTHTSTLKSMLTFTVVTLTHCLCALSLHPLSPHVQPVAAGYGREGRVQRHAVGQQAASPPAIGSDPECTFAPVPPGAAAASGPTATSALPGETLQGTQVHTNTYTNTHMHSNTDTTLCVCV